MPKPNQPGQPQTPQVFSAPSVNQVPIGPNAGGGGAGGGPAAGGQIPGIPGAGAPLPPPPKAPSVQVDRNQQLEGVQDEYRKYVEGIKAGTGQVLDQATTHTRDAADGMRTGLREDAAFRGVNSAQAERDLDDQSQRTLAGQHAAIAVEREKMIGDGLKTRAGMEENQQTLNQGEKRIGLDAYGQYQGAMQAYNNANQAASNALFNQLQAVLEARRSSTAPASQSWAGYAGTPGPGRANAAW